MIDAWSLLYNGLWIAGLAGALAALSAAYYQAQTTHLSIRAVLGGGGFQIAFGLAMALFCLGLMLGAGTWWERLAWSGLTVAFVAQVFWTWRPLGAERRVPLKKRGREFDTNRRRSGRGTGLGWALVLGGLLLAAALLVSAGLELRDRARSLQSHLDYLERLSEDGLAGRNLGDLEQVGQHLAGMQEDLAGIRSVVGPLLPVGRLLRWVPTYGGDLAAAPDLMVMATSALTAGTDTVEALQPAIELVGHSEGDQIGGLVLGERLLPVLAAAEPQLRLAQGELTTARQARERIELASLSPRTTGWLEKLDRYMPGLEAALDGALLAPRLLGADGQRTYLVLAQNNQELRPTGGFISGVGELRFEQGRPSGLTFSDSYAVDNHSVPHEPAPPDLRQTLWGELVFFRDANWDADFPTSARRALEIYARDRGVHADGVIALDLTALRLLVEAMGPIQVEGIPEAVTGENVLGVTQNQWSQGAGEAGLDWWLHRKDFMGQIAAAAMGRLLAGDDLEEAKLLGALRRALDEKHVLIYLDDAQAARVLRDSAWDGALPVAPPPSDTLLVVDSNVGFNKADAKVDRAVRYELDLGASGGPVANLTLTYRNTGRRPAGACIQEARYGDTYADMMDRCYWDYLRVYVPAGSELLQGPDLPWPAGSLLTQSGEAPPQLPIRTTAGPAGSEVWTAFFALAPGEERVLTFTYRLPVDILQYGPDDQVRYRLSVHKQPGTEAVPLALNVLLPPGAEVIDATPPGMPQVATDLRTDREFEITFRERNQGP